jgi:hypothetical protein
VSYPTLLCSVVLLHTAGCKQLHVHLNVVWQVLTIPSCSTCTYTLLYTRTYVSYIAPIHPHCTLHTGSSVHSRGQEVPYRKMFWWHSNFTKVHRGRTCYCTVAEYRLGCVTVLCDAMLGNESQGYWEGVEAQWQWQRQAVQYSTVHGTPRAMIRAEKCGVDRAKGIGIGKGGDSPADQLHASNLNTTPRYVTPHLTLPHHTVG